ncbi:tetratricopeptide repeat protein [Prochlorococcus marinus]|uniref:tetratricopeptide repeat protein n=1 Tax=Prochlorococcus marinus TaxID=1219 RepID=UPI0022B4D108|nr:tetratricopeptide repeat protein [Prochlorococcus marinus]
MTEGKRNHKQSGFEVETFPVPFALEETQENFTSISLTSFQKPKEQIINQAFKFHSQGNIPEALKYYEYFINQGYKDHRVFSNYGIILKTLGKLKEAELSIRKAIKLNPDYAEAYLNLGNVLNNLYNLKGAEKSYRKAIELNPNFAKAHSNLGTLLKDLGKLEEAELSTRKAIQLKPNFAEAYSNLGTISHTLGKISDSYKYLLSASKYAPNNIFYFINANLRLSTIMKSNSQIDKERSQYKQAINRLKNKKNMYYQEPMSFITSIFYLAYQNRADDREILEEFSDVISKANGMICNGFTQEQYLFSSSKRKNFKIGVCSMFLYKNHSVGKCFINVLKDLSETDIDMTLYVIPNNQSNYLTKEKYLRKENYIRKERNAYFKKIINLPNNPQMASKKILSDQLDLIFYPDIGMDSFSYIMALSRLALVQVTSLGHGSTSGIKNIDYYITHRNEPEKSDLEYTETLIRFRRLPFNFAVPEIDENNIKLKNILNSKSRFYIGLIQSLVKIHPNFDEILESILSKIDNSYLVIITDKSNYNFKTLQDRWNKKNELLIERSIFINSTGRDDFLNITRSCDIMLDPFYFGGGVTFYEAMAYGIPFITYPHNQKVRIVSAGYEQMKIKNPPIAKSPEDYINWCIKYSQDKLLLESIKKELKQQAEKYLFNDNEIYKDYYEFFTDSIKKAREYI